jgi:uncharacterized protein (TIGR02145 family)
MVGSVLCFAKKSIFLICSLLYLCISDDCYAFINKLTMGKVIDMDGNIYNTLKIGSKEWMIENLNVSRYNNGDFIKNIEDYDLWNSATSGAWAYYENNKENAKISGRLYNWYVISDKRGICPKGWHVPSDIEWKELIDCLGGNAVAGATITYYSCISHLSHREGDYVNINNYYTGSRYVGGAFCFKRYNSYYWTSTKKYANQSWYVSLNYYDSRVYMDYNYIKNGMSIRCVKDDQ